MVHICKAETQIISKYHIRAGVLRVMAESLDDLQLRVFSIGVDWEF